MSFWEAIQSAGGYLGAATTGVAAELYRRFRAAETAAKKSIKTSNAAFDAAGAATARALEAIESAHRAENVAGAARAKVDEALQRRLATPAGGTIATRVPQSDLEQAVRDFYEGVFKRAVRLDLINIVDNLRVELREMVNDQLTRFTRSSRPDLSDPVLQDRTDRLEKQLERVENEVDALKRELRDDAHERRRSWSELDRLTGELRGLLKNRRR
jgi:hypothetical protein